MPFADIAEEAASLVLDRANLFGQVKDTAAENSRRAPAVARRTQQARHVHDLSPRVHVADEQSAGFARACLFQVSVHALSDSSRDAKLPLRVVPSPHDGNWIDHDVF